MARPLRIDHAGGYYHVTSRGVAQQDIFLDDADRKSLLELLGSAHERWGLVFHGYCLMSNHYHLEVETPDANLSRAMQWVNQVYASGVNRRYRRAGHLFQGRFKSVLVEGESYLDRLTRYIHLNPVRARLVSHPGDYRWSSYREYVGLRKCPPWLKVSATLGRFGGSRSEQRRKYREYVEKPVGEDPLREAVFGAVLGGRRFVEWARGQLARMREDGEVSGLAKARPRVSLARILAVVQGTGEAGAGLVVAKGRKRNEARDVAIYLAREHSGCRLSEIGSYFGDLSASAASHAHRRTADRLRKSRRLRGWLKELEADLAQGQQTSQ